MDPWAGATMYIIPKCNGRVGTPVGELLSECHRNKSRLAHRVGTVLNPTNPRRPGASSLFVALQCQRLYAGIYSCVVQLRELISRLHIGRTTPRGRWLDCRISCWRMR